jgi:ATP-dependent RNA helicase DDX19/DBP5|uniref:RNA helicase n=1 Tax=Panagrolaimus sp. PS1159 TaxID=55785 RepID=A0AC35GUG1_9BILA
MFYDSASAAEEDNGGETYEEGEEYNVENSQTIYHSSSAFEDYNLKPELIAACYSLGFQRPSRVQAFCLKSFDEGSPSLVIQSQNGTGKTVAFLLPIVQRIDPNLKSPQCVIVVPTLELAQQTVKIARELCVKLPEIQVQEVSTMVDLYGKSITEQIIIGSPGRIHGALQRNRLPLRHIKFLVFDEADVMFDMQGNIDIGTKIAYHITKDYPNIRTCFCSATYNERTNHVIGILLPEYKALKIKETQLSLDNIKQYVALCYDRAAKFQALLYMCSACAIPSSVIFCNTRASADWIKNKMEENGRQADVLHGGQNDEQRSEVVKKFKNSEFKVLISTNLISRGLDVPQVCMVVNYDPPVVHETGEPDYRTYLHRVGRCGRFGKLGIALNLVSSEKEYEIVTKFAEHFQHEIEDLDFSDTTHLDQLMALHGAS